MIPTRYGAAGGQITGDTCADQEDKTGPRRQDRPVKMPPVWVRDPSPILRVTASSFVLIESYRATSVGFPPARNSLSVIYQIVPRGVIGFSPQKFPDFS